LATSGSHDTTRIFTYQYEPTQLIFNTHNPIFLNVNLFRRDEIKFVERDDDTHNSNHYSLSDFGTSGTTGVRQTDDYQKNYFVERYGAIKDIDLTPIIEDFMAVSGGTCKTLTLPNIYARDVA
jgi:hypothetical protein